MITKEEFHKAIVDFLQKAGFNYDVYFERVEVPDESKPYFFVELNDTRQTVDDVYCDRDIAVHIEFHPDRGEFDNVIKEDLWGAADKIDKALYPIFDILDRHITVLEITNRIFDEVLHYRFHLIFADYLPLPNDHDFMEKLDVNMKVEI